MNFCPNCGVDLRGIQGAIDKEIQPWRPWDTLPVVFPFDDNSSTADVPLGEIEITYV